MQRRRRQSRALLIARAFRLPAHSFRCPTLPLCQNVPHTPVARRDARFPAHPNRGGYGGGAPPLPIPNREVKPARADGTAMQCGRVGRRLPSRAVPVALLPRGQPISCYWRLPQFYRCLWFSWFRSFSSFFINKAVSRFCEVDTALLRYLCSKVTHRQCPILDVSTAFTFFSL